MPPALSAARPLQLTRFCVAAISIACAWAALGGSAYGSTITFTCGTPTVSGDVLFRIQVIFPFLGSGGFGNNVSVQAGSALDKCAAIAAALNQDTPRTGVSAIVTGNTVSITSVAGDFLEGLAVTSDRTNESTAISASLAPGQLVRAGR